jgi:acyl carrier protein
VCMSNLHLEIKQMIIDVLDLEDIDVEDIVDEDPLFVEGLGLDSIDALEIGLALQKRYDIKLKADSEDTRQHFVSVNALVTLVESYTTN